MNAIPHWLVTISWISLVIAVLCSLIIVIDEFSHPQHMWIMDVVWPVTALYSGPLGLWAYFSVGRSSTHEHMHAASMRDSKHSKMQKPSPTAVGLAATHCGAGCTLGDLSAEWLVFVTGLSFLGLPYHPHLVASWTIDFIFAYVFGIIFQYFTIAPMRHLSFGRGIVAAIKADTASLLAWQIGMYGWMAITSFLIFGQELSKTSPVFWFMMQAAMLVGFATAYPVNWWLLRAGLKEKM